MYDRLGGACNNDDWLHGGEDESEVDVTGREFDMAQADAEKGNPSATK